MVTHGVGVTIDIPESVTWESAPDLRLEGEQGLFASRSLAEWLADTREARERGDVVPFLVRENGRPVGFFALAAGDRELAPYGREGSGAVLLRNFLVVPEAQGKGVARAMMERLPSVARRYFPKAPSLCLVVNFRNAVAKRVYLRHGFTDTGEVWTGGKAGPAHVYECALPPVPVRLNTQSR